MIHLLIKYYYNCHLLHCKLSANMYIFLVYGFMRWRASGRRHGGRSVFIRGLPFKGLTWIFFFIVFVICSLKWKLHVTSIREVSALFHFCLLHIANSQVFHYGCCIWVNGHTHVVHAGLLSNVILCRKEEKKLKLIQPKICKIHKNRSATTFSFCSTIRMWSNKIMKFTLIIMHKIQSLA